MDTKWPYNAFTMIKPEKQQTDFRFTPQGSKHEKNKIAIRFLSKKYFKILQFKHVLCLMRTSYVLCLMRPIRQVSSKKVLFGLIFRSALLFVSTLL